MAKPVPKNTITPNNGGIGGKRGGNTAKRSGTYFEKVAEDYFNDVCIAKRVLGSGAFGSVTRDPNLLGDVNLYFPTLRATILADCKFGYSRGESQMTLKKEWFDKIDREAKLARKYPAVITKFKGQRGPNSRIISFSWDTFKEMMKDIMELVECD